MTSLRSRSMPWCRLRLIVPALAALVFGFQSPARAQLLELSPQLQNNLRYVQVGMSAGRVTASAAFSGRNFSSNTQSEERQESLKVDMTQQSPSIDYQLTTKTFKVAVALSNGNQLRITREPLGSGTLKPLELNQPAEGTITLRIGPPGDDKTYEADSLWHLMTAEPEVAKVDLEPLLRLLRPGWPLASITKSVEESLFKQAESAGNFDRRAWSALVAQLGSSKYVDREDADRRLRELGQTVVPYLRNLDAAHLDPEQAFRIRAIAKRYQTDEKDDSPEAVAGWLAADPEIWYALAARAPAARRAIIRDQLTRILGEDVKLDPDADAEKLQLQLSAVRNQIDRLQRATAAPK